MRISASRVARFFSAACLSLLIAACGSGVGSGGSNSGSEGDNSVPPPVTPPITPPTTPTGDNVQPISVNPGPVGTENLAFTSVTVCEPGTTQCRTIDHVFIDTGSTGLRVLASALNGLSLPQQLSSQGHASVECVQFVDLSHTWGPVKLADVKIAGKQASSIPIQVIGGGAFTEPVTCANGDSSANQDTVEKLGGNGVLGVGNFQQDCGVYCTIVVANSTYYDCPSSGCSQTTASLNSQLQNPIAFFAADNNGVIIDLPAVPASGRAFVNGWMIFGIGTRDNNALGNAKIYTIDNLGYVTTRYKGVSYPESFIDSGSNGLFFPDDNLPDCAQALGFYCPSRTQRLSATIIGANNVSSKIAFSVANADRLDGDLAAFNNLAGFYNAGFDWGMPFFYGRKVFTAIEDAPGIATPYVAF